jgi:hypothetical protein
MLNVTSQAECEPWPSCGDLAPIFLNFQLWMKVSDKQFDLIPLSTGKVSLAPIIYEAGWNPDSAWRWW